MHDFIIIGTLIYVLSSSKKEVLMVHRHRRETDDQLGYYNGLGGKLENNETLIESMQRELLEEANIQATKFLLRGFIHWNGFGKRRERWMGAVFLVEEFSGTPISENAEGSLSFIPLTEVGNLHLFPGDHLFLPKVFDASVPLFHALLNYDGKEFLGGYCH